MASDTLAKIAVPTRLGAIHLEMAAERQGATKPILLVIPGTFSTLDEVVKLADSASFFATIAIVRLPDNGAMTLTDPSLAAFSRALSETIETIFASRSVIVFGVSIGGAIALGVRAANVTRIVVVEPLLTAADLWPLTGPLRAHLQKLADPAAHRFIFEAFGLDATRAEERDRRAISAGLDAPVDVIVGETPLQPPRQLTRFPSFVGQDVRARLAATPGFRMHVARGAGHNVVGQAPRPVRDVLLEAVRRGSIPLEPARRGLDEPLLEATPAAARKALHWGAGGAAFRMALNRVNPRCDLRVLGDADRGLLDDDEGDFDAIVLGATPPEALFRTLIARMKPGGHLIARGLRVDLQAHGLTGLEPVDAGGTDIVRAQAGPAQTALHLKTVVYSGLLMDIRTRLPVRGLRSDPGLQVVFETAPFELPALPRDAPKVVVLQRPAELRPEAWVPFLTNCVRNGWIAVMEYDDYPPLIAEVQGRPSSEADLLRFGYLHAVQTASPPLVDLFRPYNPEVVLFPNAVFELAPFPEGAGPRKVFYGGVIRGRYAVDVARSLGPAIERSPEVEYVVIGDRAVFDALPTTAKHYHDYMSFEAYLELMAQCSVSLSPIEALPMRETKSDAKFLDASRAGVLTIASPTIYDRVIEHGENGFLAREISDWAPLLSRALTDEPLRARMARRAWEQVRDERMFADQVAQRRDWYFDLWSRRAVLNDALMSRLPGLREAVAG